MRLPKVPIKLALIPLSILAVVAVGTAAWAWKANGARATAPAEAQVRPARVIEINYHLQIGRAHV